MAITAFVIVMGIKKAIAYLIEQFKAVILGISKQIEQPTSPILF